MSGGKRGPTDPTWFRQVLGQYPTGVCVVTALEPDASPTGFVVGSFTSVSLDPPLVAFFPDKSSTSWPKIEAAQHFCVNVLGSEQEELCRRFAAKGIDRFEGVDWRPTAAGRPVIDGVVAWIDCDLEEVEEAGDHYIVLGRVLELDVEESSLPLLFFQGGYGRFEPLSLAAPDRGGELTEQLRLVDLVRPEMERLAADLSARCIATARDEDRLAVIASAGGANTSAAATLVGQRLPFGPPTWSAFAAWMEDEEVENKLAEVDNPALSEDCPERLALVRERGYSVGLINEAFATAIDRLAENPEAISHEELRGLVEDLVYDPAQLTATEKEDIRSITVPVFGPSGEVAIALTAYGFSKPPDSAGVDHYIEAAVASASRATDRLGGRVPEAGERSR